MTTRKIYIDSRQAQGTGSDFQLTLKQSVQVPENTVAYIDDIIIPNCFLTIDASRCWVYMSETFGSATVSFRTQMAYGNYSGIDLAAALQAALRRHTIGLALLFVVSLTLSFQTQLFPEGEMAVRASTTRHLTSRHRHCLIRFVDYLSHLS